MGYPTLKAMAVILQANLNKIGMKATITELEISPWIDRIASHPDFDITVDNYNTVPEDPAGMFNSDNLAPENNINMWNPPGTRRSSPRPRANPTREAHRALPAAAEAAARRAADDHDRPHPDHRRRRRRTVKGAKLGPSGIYDWSRARSAVDRVAADEPRPCRPAGPPGHEVRSQQGRDPVGAVRSRQNRGALITLFVISVLSFFTIAMVPGNPAEVMLGTYATPERLEAVKHEFGLDQPLVVRYGYWLKETVQGNLGESVLSHQPVTKLLGDGAARDARADLSSRC